jgi:hypothetical protein
MIGGKFFWFTDILPRIGVVVYSVGVYVYIKSEALTSSDDNFTRTPHDNVGGGALKKK